jgi:hypothetical protein
MPSWTWRDPSYHWTVTTLTSVAYRWLGLPLSLATLAGSVPGVADAPQLSGFVWEAPPECPRRSVVLRQLADVLGFGNAADAETVLARGRARGSIQRDGERWVLELEVRDETGLKRRRLESEQCTDLGHAAALALALLLNDAAAGNGNAPAETPSAAGAPPAVVPAGRPAATPPLKRPYPVDKAPSVRQMPPFMPRLAKSR